MNSDNELETLSQRAIFKVNTNRALGQCENVEILELLEALAGKFEIDRDHGKIIEESTKEKYTEGRIG